MFLKEEYAKCLNALKDADATSPDYAYVLQNLSFVAGSEELINHAMEVAYGDGGCCFCEKKPQVVKLFNDVEEESSPDNVEDEPDPAPPQKEYTKADLRKALYAAKKNGFDVVEIYRKYGATNINDVPEAVYASIIEEYGDAK